MSMEEERVYNENVSQLLREVSLPLSTQNTAVSTLQFSVAMAGPSGTNLSTLSTNAVHGTSSYVPEFFPQSSSINAGNFDGFSVPGNFSAPATMTMPYPWLRRAFPLNYSNPHFCCKKSTLHSSHTEIP